MTKNPDLQKKTTQIITSWDHTINVFSMHVWNKVCFYNFQYYFSVLPNILQIRGEEQPFRRRAISDFPHNCKLRWTIFGIVKSENSDCADWRKICIHFCTHVIICLQVSAHCIWRWTMAVQYKQAQMVFLENYYVCWDSNNKYLSNGENFWKW